MIFFATIKSFEVLSDAANNQADSGMAGLMQAGLGLGAGLPIGQKVGEAMTISETNETDTDGVVEKVKKLRSLLDLELISQEEYDLKRIKILDEL